MNALTIPRDDSAEAVVASSCLRFPEAWTTAEPLITTSEMYVPRYRRIVEMALRLPVPCPLPEVPDGLTVLDMPWLHFCGREWAVIEAGADPATVRELWDYIATRNLVPYASRVHEAARRREAMTIMEAAYIALGAGAGLDDVRPMLERLAA